jgi:hypothetical protein
MTSFQIGEDVSQGKELFKRPKCESHNKIVEKE